jgi:hypothetical protein
MSQKAQTPSLFRKAYQDNEASVDVVSLIEAHEIQFNKIKLRYGGHLGHLFCSNSLAVPQPAVVNTTQRQHRFWNDC